MTIMNSLPVKTFLIVLILHTQQIIAWVNPEEFVRLKAEAEMRCPVNDSQCRLGERCVLISHCKSECVGVSKGLLQTDRQFQQHLRDIYCGLCDGKERVCCANNSVTPTAECPGLYQDMGVADTGTCGVRSSYQAHVIGGEDTNPGDWPWVARLSPGLCGGTLVSRRHVLTAAHCVETDREPRSVILGDSDTRTDYDCLDVRNGVGCSTTGLTCYREELCAPKHLNIKIREIIRHPDYSYGSVPVFDVAVLVLDTRVVLTDFIKPACLPPLGDNNNNNNSNDNSGDNNNNNNSGPLTLTGWGNTAGGSLSPFPAYILQELLVREVEVSECRDIWQTRLGIELLPSHMCARALQEFQSSCKGDSGGAVVRGREVFEVAGVISFGIETCGNTDYPMGFTRIAGAINRWIHNIIGRELPNNPT